MAIHTSISTSEFGDKARRELLHLLEQVRGKKNLVIARCLAAPLNLFVKFSTLQEYGVDRVFFVENSNVDSSQRNVIFLARGDKSKHVTAIAEQIRMLRHNGQVDHEFSVLWVPRRTLVSDQIFEEAGVLGEVNVHEYPLYFMPLADDLLSLELDDAFKDLYLWQDPSAIFTSAKALMLMQQKHGLFPRIIGKGDNAKRLADLLVRMRSEISADDESGGAGSSMLDLAPSQSIESLIIIDREVDFPTILLTQLTYEGLIDEFYGIASNQTEIDYATVGAAPTPAGSSSTAASQSLKRKIPLDATDALYATLRDSNCAVVGPILSGVARRLQSTSDRNNIAAKTTAELREFVKELPGYQAEQASLKLHTNLAGEIINRTGSDIFSRVLEVQQNIAAGADPTTQHESIEELIARDVPLPTILRLLCIESTVSNGIRPRDLENFKKAILQGYGYQHLLTLSALERMGLLIPRIGGGLVGASAGPIGKTTNYNSVRKTLNMILDDVNETEPDDVAYVFSGYAPLSVRLAQCIVQKQYLINLTTQKGTNAPAAAASTAAQGWRPFEDTVRQIRGATFDEAQLGDEKAVRARQIINGSERDSGKTVVVFFLGGVCRAEVAALRFVAKQLKEEGRGKKLLICTTGVLTGDRVVEAAIEKRSFAN
ncbi:Sec1-like protein [Tothia fuscella]|uniref:Sec1-like protein n=1 Tax=Tothia fuscella TaxID=1048955 RepID=A0A9P4P1T8_9PEZI|nr:Sec1-like protein [Tothia fuscella]